ncbi:nucleotide sugar dehydrogenase [Oleiharenicola sp. Vm1]|uniref:nucleotide sugar dehydrogenase n=1 Tax=Oleiharenicola sp. Vm1 TaxID=3398393 RepID=UPI0039F59684
MKIAVFGLGYVGVVTAGCFARDGHEVIGVDVSAAKVAELNGGRSPILEKDIPEIVRAAVAQGRLSATTTPSTALEGVQMAFVCVGTPSRADGSLDTSFLERVLEQIGQSLRGRKLPLTLVIRSTVLPGTVRRVALPILEQAAGRPAGDGYEVLFHPEFLRESCAVRDFDEPPKIVIGERAPGAGADRLLELYPGIVAPRWVTAYETAEMVKYTDNVYHALKVTFANEIGLVSQSLGVDAALVMEIFRSDTKLNISPAYFRPGFAFGGSCLPKDTRALTHSAARQNVQTPVLHAILSSNRAQIDRVVARLLATGKRRIGFHGLAFKPGTDDLRESQFVELAERLLGKGCELRIYDEHVHYTHLTGRNKAYVDEALPHLARLLVAEQVALEGCELIVLAHPAPAARVEAWLAAGVIVFDLGPGRSLGREAAGYLTVV